MSDTLVRPAPSKEERAQRLLQRSTRIPQGQRKGSRNNKRRAAIEESRRG